MEGVWNAPVLGAGMYPVNFIGQAAVSEQNTGWERTTVDEWDYNYEDEKELGEKERENGQMQKLKMEAFMSGFRGILIDGRRNYI